MTYTVEEYATEADWLAARASGIGASDVAAALGLSKWKTPYTLWAELSGLLPRTMAETIAMRTGKDLEPIIADRYAEQTGRKVENWGRYTILRSIEHPFLFATLDRHQVDPVRGRGALELKATGFSPDWLNEPPEGYQAQLQAQLVVAGYSWGTLAVMPWGQPVEHWDMERNADFCALMVERLTQFWQRVKDGNPPATDGTPRTREALKAVYAKVVPEKIVRLPDVAVQWDAEIEECKAEIKRLEERKRAAEAHLITALGDAQSGLLPGGGSWSYAETRRDGYTVEPTTFRQLRRRAK